ncbi:hypothetical protein VSX64_16025 [Aurantimonas sp. C2-6-R+9]|uniref:hypothetical protein n=1 Tax=unclassified Aurantimonas TaxID=2638230 RepID=UPI002E191D7D|nr:hypothetical protein [Aurantimonas sp. C2-6-R+9]
MSAQLIYDLAPLGSTVTYSDGTPRPPERFRKKLAAWENRNNGGRLIRTQAARRVGDTVLPASITLHEGNYGDGGVVVLTVHRSFSVSTDLKFVVTERPTIGSVRILDRPGEDAELLHLAESRAHAESWLTTHRYPNAVLDEVTADAVAADLVEGRAAA